MTANDLAWETLDRRNVNSCEAFDIYNEDVRFPIDDVRRPPQRRP